MYARRPFRHSADTLTCWPRNLSMHSQFGPLRMGMHCGRKRGGLLTAGPVANMNLTRLNSNSGLYEHTRPPTKADLTVDMPAEAQSRRPGLEAPRMESLLSVLRPPPGPAAARLSLVDRTVAPRPIQPRV